MIHRAVRVDCNRCFRPLQSCYDVGMGDAFAGGIFEFRFGFHSFEIVTDLNLYTGKFQGWI